MKANHSLQCGLAAAAVVRVPLADVAELRRRPGPVPPGTLSSSFLKHSDEQSVVGLTAVYQAIQAGSLGGTDFSQWGVLAAPRWLGRNTVCSVLSRFAVEGAWGVSPHLIPHRSLHSLSGTVSLALKAQGPNYGVAGSQGAVSEVMLSALALLHRYQLPGVWVVLTQIDPELPPQVSGQPLPGTVGIGVALALTPWRPGSGQPCLRIQSSIAQPREQPVSVDSLIVLLERLQSGTVRQILELDHGAWLEVTLPAAQTSDLTRAIRPPVRWTLGLSAESKR